VADQVEIQLGHLCNNRCVFCVSGQRTARGQAGVAELEPLLASIRAARASGHTTITLLGGEPTLQPVFMDVLRECGRLGFSEVVIFTNGAKTAREGFVDEILATGVPVSFRLSIQGATEESHERTTKKPGSFDRLVRTMQHLHARGARITVNACIVRSNHEDLARFPALLEPFGVRQLHLDLMRPADAGDRTEEELASQMPRFSELVPPMRAMVAGFSPGFDVNLGNLPYCVAPDLARVIHHDGERTETIAIDGDDLPSAPWDKYEVKRRDKVKPESCARCVFSPRCSGVFDRYASAHGTSELVPIDRAQLDLLDPSRRLHAELGLDDAPIAEALARPLARLRALRRFGGLRITKTSVDGLRAELTLEGDAGERAIFFLDMRVGAPKRSGYRVESGESSAVLRDGLRALIDVLSRRTLPIVHEASRR
jgi:MoaA/NifB/PqqE/SkfB family radical SAM enzyme